MHRHAYTTPRSACQLALIKRLWDDHADGSHKFICTKDRAGKWHQISLDNWSEGTLRQVCDRNQRSDLYFCPHGFDAPTRTAGHSVLPRMLYADLDEVNPRSVKPLPTIAWMSSPGRYQCIWLLTRAVRDWEVNRKLTYAIGADRGGHDLTQVLRIPGSVNYKYDDGVEGKLLWSDGDVYDPSVFDGLPEVGTAAEVEFPTGDLGRIAARAYARINRNLLPMVIEWINAKKSPKEDRSEPQFFIEQSLREAGATREECYAIIKVQLRWNKFDDDQLWDEIGRIYSDEKVLVDEPDLDPNELTHIPPREWLYGSHYIKDYATSTASPGGVGKTSLAMVEASAMATGKSLLGQKPWAKLKVWYIGEDPRTELLRRVKAICIHYGIKDDEWVGRLTLTSMRDQKFVVVQKTRSVPLLASPMISAVEQFIKSKNIDVVIVDPFVKTHELEENDNKSIDMVADAWNGIASRCRVSIELPHHTRKLNGQAATEDSGRGGSAMRDALRSNRMVSSMTEEEAASAKVDDRWRYFHVWNAKRNMAPPSDDAEWYVLRSVGLDNATRDRAEDSVQVVEAWRFPQPGRGVITHLIKALQSAMGDKAWGYDQRSPDYIGHLVAKYCDVPMQVFDDWVDAGWFIKGRETVNRNYKLVVRVGKRANGGIIITFPDKTNRLHA